MLMRLLLEDRDVSPESTVDFALVSYKHWGPPCTLCGVHVFLGILFFGRPPRCADAWLGSTLQKLHPCADA